jgi:hypothetical protein
MRLSAPGLITACMLLGAAACGGGTQSSVTTSSAPTSEAPAPTAEPEVATPAPAVTTAATSDKVISFKMPNLVGKDLQTAQNTVQTYGVFYSISHDLLGSRHQVVDSNWIVCNQTPRAGSTVRGMDSELEGKIDFGVVKRDESCP